MSTDVVLSMYPTYNYYCDIFSFACLSAMFFASGMLQLSYIVKGTAALIQCYVLKCVSIGKF